MKALTYKILGILSLSVTLASCSKVDKNIMVRGINQQYAQFAADTFDVDGDGAADLFIRVYYDASAQYAVQGDAIDIIGLNGATIVSKSKSFWIYMFPALIPYKIASPLSAGTTIDGSLGDFDDTLFISFDGTAQGERKTEEEWKQEGLYFGFTIQKDGNTHYGWGSLEVIDFIVLQVNELAYNIQPNTAVKAGRN